MNECRHEHMIVEEKNQDLIGTCQECGEVFYFRRDSIGLYAFNLDKQSYLLNTGEDLDLSKNDYSFQIGCSNYECKVKKMIRINMKKKR